MSQVTSLDCENPYRSPQAEIPSTVERRNPPGFLRCLFGTVAVAGFRTAGLTVILLPTFLATRADTALLALCLGAFFFASALSIATKLHVAWRRMGLPVVWGLKLVSIGILFGIYVKDFLIDGTFDTLPVAAILLSSVVGGFCGLGARKIEAWLLPRHDDTSQ